MKKRYPLVFGLLSSVLGLQAQIPQLINYQAVARDGVGNALHNQHVGLRISIHDGSPSGNVVYMESDTTTTNMFGLLTLKIGGGIATTGNFSTIGWDMGSKYLQVELDPNGSSNYVDMGTSELLSVPYALSAGNGLSKGTQTGNTPYWNGNQWVTTSSNIYNDGTHVGIGTSSLINRLSVAGAVDFIRTAADGMNYELNMSDSFRTTNGLTIPHIALFVGPPVGLHSVVSLENTALCCGQDSLTAVMGILDNSGPFHHIIRMTQTDFYLRAAEVNSTMGEYHVSAAGISFNYRDNLTSSSWMLSNRMGKAGQVLTLNSTADTAQWKSLTNFSNLNYSAPGEGAMVALNTGSNIIEPATSLTSVSLILPFNPSNGDLVALSFVKPITTINYTGGTIVNGTTTAPAGTTIKYIYYAAVGKWYNW